MKVFRLQIQIFLIIVGLFISQSAYAQSHDFYNSTGIVVPGLKLKPYEIQLLGDNYFDEHWQIADIELVGDSLEIRDANIRIDITNHVIEIDFGDEIKLLPSSFTKTVTIKNDSRSQFVARGESEFGDPIGFYKILYDGDQKLLCHYSTRIELAQYNEALGTGQRDDKILKIQTYYISKEDKLVALEMKKSKLADQLGGGEALLKYIKDERLSLKNEIDLIQMFQYAVKQKASD